MTAKKISKKLSKELQNLESMGPEAHAVEVEKELDAEEKRKNALGRADERIKRSKVSSGTISMYLSEISQYEPLSPDKEVELAVLIAKGDKKAMKELVEANLRFVVSVAKKYQGNGLSLSDIINLIDIGEFFSFEKLIRLFKLLPVPEIKTAVFIFLDPVNIAI